jgi:hypothetical protein
MGLALATGLVVWVGVTAFLFHKEVASPSAAVFLGLGAGLVVLIWCQCANASEWLKALPVLCIPLALALLLVPTQAATTRQGVHEQLANVLNWPRQVRESQQPDPTYLAFCLTAEHAQMTRWVKEHTPPDSVFYLTKPDASFRFFAQRAAQVCYPEWCYGLYAAVDPLKLFATGTSLSKAVDKPDLLVARCWALGVNYVITTAEADALPAAKVYENKSYTIYKIDNPRLWRKQRKEPERHRQPLCPFGS